MSVARVGLDLAASILQVHGVTLPAKPPSADAWPAAAAPGFSFTLPAILEAFSQRVPCE
jgi:hypothetical protein